MVRLDGERTGEQPVRGLEQVHAARAWRARDVVATEIETCFTFAIVSTAELPGALARSQAARRRRVLDATLALAADGGFDAVQMRDVAAAADVALGTVYRYFSSKERLLLEAMAEQQADLRAYLHTHPPTEPTPADRVLAVLGALEPVAAPATPTSPRRWCARSARPRSRTPTSCARSPRS